MASKIVVLPELLGPKRRFICPRSFSSRCWKPRKFSSSIDEYPPRRSYPSLPLLRWGLGRPCWMPAVWIIASTGVLAHSPNIEIPKACPSCSIDIRLGGGAWILSPRKIPSGGAARPTAKRRAGLLVRVASPNGGINSLVLASGCCPVRFDLDHSLFSGLESNAADRSVRSTQTNPPDAPLIRDRSRGECLDTSVGLLGV